MKRAYLKGFTRSNPQDVNWRGMRPKPTSFDTAVPRTKVLTLDQMEVWQGLKDKNGKLPQTCPPRAAALIRFREISESGGQATYYPVNLYRDHERTVDMFTAGTRIFFVEMNFKLKLISKSMTYFNRAVAMQCFANDKVSGERGIDWKETVSWEDTQE